LRFHPGYPDIGFALNDSVLASLPRRQKGENRPEDVTTEDGSNAAAVALGHAGEAAGRSDICLKAFGNRGKGVRRGPVDAKILDHFRFVSQS